MNEKRIPLTTEEPKHKKKSTAKGQSRADHKHTYETVLLYNHHHYKDLRNGDDKVSTYTLPIKVCTICGRISHTDTDPSYYVEKESNLRWLSHITELSDKALALPKWECNNFDKFATKVEEECNND